ncbi:MAG: hypothetical protein ACJAYB_000350 [Psychromonas sp.]|jgi:hypothetical protein
MLGIERGYCHHRRTGRDSYTLTVKLSGRNIAVYKGKDQNKLLKEVINWQRCMKNSPEQPENASN